MAYKNRLLEMHIDCFSVLDIHNCIIKREYLLQPPRVSADFVPRSVFCFLIPYFTGAGENISAYAVSRDYHGYAGAVTRGLCEALRSDFPSYTFLGFCDHSPLDEKHAAMRAGLGVLGKNGLLLNDKYGSFVFIAEIISDIPPEKLGEPQCFPIKECAGCGACVAACPTGFLRETGEECLSAITQKKGTLSDKETAYIRQSGCVWGCDACQTVCPVNQRVIRKGTALTSIPYFWEERLPCLTSKTVTEMTEEAFSSRAYSWRGRQTVLRNLALLEPIGSETEDAT